MTRRRGLAQAQRDLYLSQRAIGDLRAAQRGPAVLAKRLIRRRVTRSVLRGWKW